MDGWMDGYMDGWMDGWRDGWLTSQETEIGFGEKETQEEGDGGRTGRHRARWQSIPPETRKEVSAKERRLWVNSDPHISPRCSASLADR
jgi:hypothetical protein